MRLVAVLDLLLAACGGGAYVEVHPQGADVVEVELVTAANKCRKPGSEEACDQVQGQNFAAPMGQPGDLYKRGTVGTAPVIDGVAVFELDPSEPVAIAFAIGRDIQDQPVEVAVLDHTIDDVDGPKIYRVDLDPAEDLLANQRSPGAAGVTVWGPAADHCIGVAPVRPHTRSPLFILADDNFDCDARRNDDPTECEVLWFDGMSFDDNTAKHCVVADTTINGTIDRAPCVLGHQPSCMEVIPPNPMQVPCKPTISCLPDAVCSPVDGCVDTDEVCQQQILLSAVAPAITCNVPGTPVGGESARCATPIDNLIPTTAIALPIESAEFIQPPMAGMFLPYHGQRTTKLVLGTLEYKLSENAGKFTITATGDGPLNHKDSTILVITVDAGMGQQRELWFPISLVLTDQGCNVTGGVPCATDGTTDNELSCGM